MYDDYFEPSPSDEIVDEIISIAKVLFSEEIKMKIERLEKTVEEQTKQLNKYYDFAKIEEKYKRKISTLEQKNLSAYKEGYDACKRERTTKLLNLEKGYGIRKTDVLINDKCDKCDDERNIHFKSPSGRELTEKCSCAKVKPLYRVDPVTVDTWYFDGNSDKPSRYYKRFRDSNEDEFCLDDTRIWIYRDFADYDKIVASNECSKYWQYVFESEADALKYCDFMNSKNKE